MTVVLRRQQPIGFRQAVVLLNWYGQLCRGQAYGVSLFRPLARLARITLRPPTVRERARNPWVRARLMRLG